MKSVGMVLIINVSPCVSGFNDILTLCRIFTSSILNTLVGNLFMLARFHITDGGYNMYVST